MQKNIKILVGVCLIVGAGSFAAGVLYGGMQNTPKQNFAGSSDQAGGGMGGGGQGRGGRNFGGRGGATNGEVISKDDKSITLKMRDGGSKIIFYTQTTKTMKSIEGNISDIDIGTNIMANGDANPDGSITAQMLNIRPPMPTSSSTTSTIR